MEYRYATFFRLLNALIDYIVLNAMLISGLIMISPDTVSTTIAGDLRFHVVLVNLLWFFSATLLKLYDRVLKTEAVPFLKKAIWTLVLFSSALMLLNLISPKLIISEDYLIPFLLLFSLTIVGFKIGFLSIRKSQRKFWVDYKKVVILGSTQVSLDLYDHFKENPNSGYIVQGYFADERKKGLPGDFHYLGAVEDSVTYASNNGISEIFSALASNKLDLVKSLMQQADHKLIRFRFVPDLSAFLDKNIMVEYYGALPIISPRKEPLEVKVNELLKQSFDYLFATGTVLFIMSWLVPIIAIAIKLDSKGPIFFRQLRSGKDNKPFFCFKFRSMRVNDEADTLQATKNDARITRVGAFLRRSNLDEFPQFFNVLLGDMSIVGPRPHMLKHSEDYSQLIDDFMVRQFVTPGITGWAQVNGLRGETKETASMMKRVKADLWYMENWSFLLDFKIVFLTMWQIVKRDEKAF